MNERAEIDEAFWPLLEAKLKAEAAIYNPVHLGRLYPFLVSHFPARMIAMVLARAIDRGLIAVDVIGVPRAHGDPEKVRFVRLI